MLIRAVSVTPGIFHANFPQPGKEGFRGGLAAVAREEGFARANGTKVSYVKPHGAMYNAIVKDEAQAEAVIKGIKAFGDLPVMLLPGGVAVDVAKRSGLNVIREAFADRNYNPDGTLVSRKEANAVLGSADEVVQRVLEVAQTGSITALDGPKVEVD